MSIEYQEYKKFRKDGYPASSALHYARIPKPEYLFDITGERTEWEQDGFDMVAVISVDEYADLSWLGEFVNDPSEGTVKNPNYERGRYPYIKIATTEEEHYQDLIKLKYGKAEARRLAKEYFEQDAKRMGRYATGDLEPLSVCVSVFFDDREVGSASLGGIDVDSYDDPHMYEIIAELAEEALAEAREWAEKLSVKINSEE